MKRFDRATGIGVQGTVFGNPNCPTSLAQDERSIFVKIGYSWLL